MSESGATERWEEGQTTFQRVYDVLVGTQSFLSASEFADRVACSETGARDALEQFVEMGIARHREGRPTTYRRNDSYFEWRRVESLAREHSVTELQERVDELIATDERLQEKYGVPGPTAVSTADLPVDDHDALHERWADLSEWRTVRRDIRLLRRAVERSRTRVDDGMQA
jgi:hypothetical protein